MYVYRLRSDAAAYRSAVIGLNVCKLEQLRDQRKHSSYVLKKMSQESPLKQPEM